ncbi:MAG: phosphate-starvation-inducible PsiE family protein [Nitrospiraceae bacterium]|nr:phosphate-starvation-inducible PsiE family protein [Nitrospiraceae bacterium]
MTQTTMEQTLSNGWPKRFIITLTAYDITRAWEAGTRFILSLLTLTILLGLAGGVVKTFLDLRLLLSADLDIALRHIIVDALTLLAVVEVLKTTLTYCSDGRVRVTFIVDTVLVVMLTEIISRWFTAGSGVNSRYWEASLITLAHAHPGRPIQPGADDVYATGQSTGPIISIISLGGTYAYKFSS